MTGQSMELLHCFRVDRILRLVREAGYQDMLQNIQCEVGILIQSFGGNVDKELD